MKKSKTVVTPDTIGGGLFATLPRAAVFDARLTPADKAVLMVLAARADNRTGKCWPSNARLARESALSPATVRRALQSLRGCGYVTWTERRREDGGQASHVFTVHYDVYLAPVPDQIGDPEYPDEIEEAVTESDAAETPLPRMTPPPAKNDTLPPITGDSPPLSPMTPQELDQGELATAATREGDRPASPPASLAVRLAICANQTITAAQGEQVHPITPARAEGLAAHIRESGIAEDFALAFLADKLRFKAVPPHNLNYFREALTEAWAEHTARQQASESPALVTRETQTRVSRETSAARTIAAELLDLATAKSLTRIRHAAEWRKDAEAAWDDQRVKAFCARTFPEVTTAHAWRTLLLDLGVHKSGESFRGTAVVQLAERLTQLAPVAA